MKSGYVVYINSDPANVVGLFFQQNFPGGKTAQQAAAAYAATLVDASTSNPVGSDVKAIEIDDYQLQTSQDINL